MKKVVSLSVVVGLAICISGCGTPTEENTTSKPVDASTKAGVKTNSGPAGAVMDGE